MSTTIRRMTQPDLDTVLRLAAQTPEAPQWTQSIYEQILLPEPADPLRCCWVALRGDTPVAFAVTSWLRGEVAAEVESVVVDPYYRRQGIGGALLGVSMSWAAAAGAAAIRLEVRASNAAAIALYRRRGFTPAAVRTSYYVDPVEDALLLQANLLRT